MCVSLSQDWLWQCHYCQSGFEVSEDEEPVKVEMEVTSQSEEEEEAKEKKTEEEEREGGRQECQVGKEETKKTTGRAVYSDVVNMQLQIQYNNSHCQGSLL